MARLEGLIQEAVEGERSGWRPQFQHSRHRALVKFSVITGGIAVFLTGAIYLPPANPVTQAVDYTVYALVRQMPSEVTDPPDLGSVIIGNPDRQHRPLRPMAMVKAILPVSSSQPDSASAAAVAAPVPTSTAPAGLPGSASVAIPVVKGEKVVPTSAPTAGAPIPTSAPPTAVPLPTTLPPPPAPPVVVPGVVDPPPPPTPVETPTPTPLPTEPPTPEPTPLPTAIPTPSPSP